MIVLPDRSIPRARFLLPVRDQEWRTPSQTLPKDEFGNDGVRTKFRLTARLSDGFVVWHGWFEDRAGADAFLFSVLTGSLRYERELWRLPTPEWHPGIGENLTYDFATVTFLTTTGANTYNVPSDWANSGSKIDCIGGGGGGGVGAGTTNRYGAGGGGGGFGRKSNFSLTPGGTASYSIGVSGAGQSRSAAGGTNGGSGGDTFFDNTTYASATVGATGGTGGAGANNALPTNGGVGGTGKGDSSASGGNGGSITSGSSGSCRTGGGGAAGFNGNGTSAGGSAAANIRTPGGSGDAGFGGAGGTSTAVNGVAGTEYQVSPAYGSGGGGAGNSTGAAGGSGGNYGGAGGGAAGASGTQTSGPGAQGLIVVEYTPAAVPSRLSNMPMMGM